MIYVPVLRCKSGENDALSMLTPEIKNQIVPIFEVDPDTVSKFDATINNWGHRKSYFDIDSALKIDTNEYFNMINKCRKEEIIPIIHINDDQEKISEIKSYSVNGYAIRCTINEIADPNFNNKISRILTGKQISDFDLIFDAQYVDDNNINSTVIVLKNAIASMNSLNRFRNIIITSGSIPSQFKISKEKMAVINRFEIILFKTINDMLAIRDVKAVYSDYTISNFAYFKFEPWMPLSFKIRYTSASSYFVYKGLTLKDGGLKFDKVHKGCVEIVELSGNYKGSTYSWGDSQIFDKYNENTTSPGNLTTWVSIDINHHITYTVKFISNQP